MESWALLSRSSKAKSHCCFWKGLANSIFRLKKRGLGSSLSVCDKVLFCPLKCQNWGSCGGFVLLFSLQWPLVTVPSLKNTLYSDSISDCFSTCAPPATPHRDLSLAPGYILSRRYLLFNAKLFNDSKSGQSEMTTPLTTSWRRRSMGRCNGTI